MRVLAACVLLAISLLRPTAYADSPSVTGSISIEITDAAKRGVAGISIAVTGSGAEQTTTTGAEQPSDAELAAAARTGRKAIDALNSQYNARASLRGLALGTVTVSFGGKKVSVTMTSDKPTWKITATVNAKTKKIVGTLKVAFDEVANARAQADGAKAEQTKAKAAADAAKAEQERARLAQEKANADQERARQDKDRADADAKRARDQAEAERLRRARAEAPTKVSVTTGRCDCLPPPDDQHGARIRVRCDVRSDAEVPVKVSIKVFAETGTWGANANGTANTDAISAKGTASYDLDAFLSVRPKCSSCKNQKCAITGVTPQ